MRRLAAAVATIGAAAVVGAAVAGAAATPRLVPVVRGLATPVFVTQAPAQPGRFYVVEQGGTIRVEASGGASVALTVSDDGCGIPADARDRLFRPYFTTKPHGTGLGLFVSRRIVEAHGGTVAVDSEVGRGTTFTVTLPAVGRAVPDIGQPVSGTARPTEAAHAG